MKKLTVVGFSLSGLWILGAFFLAIVLWDTSKDMSLNEWW